MYRQILRHFCNLTLIKGDPHPALCLECGTFAMTRVEWKTVTSTQYVSLLEYKF
jgi:hypothetical protein